MTHRLLYDSHMHTPLCKHATGTPEEYAAVAEKRGLRGIIFTCHNPAPEGYAPKVRMDMLELDEYVNMVERAREAWRGRVDIRLGLESDYMPGMEDFLEALHARAEFEFIWGSVHAGYQEYKDVYLKNDDARDFQRTYYDHLAQAAETGLFDAISHPDLVKQVHPRQWEPEAILDDIGIALDRIAKTGVAMELNTSGLHKFEKAMYPDGIILAEMRQRDIPVILGSDAHQSKRVADDFERALEAVEAAGYTQVSYILNGERHDVAISAAKASLYPLGFWDRLTV